MKPMTREEIQHAIAVERDKLYEKMVAIAHYLESAEEREPNTSGPLTDYLVAGEAQKAYEYWMRHQADPVLNGMMVDAFYPSKRLNDKCYFEFVPNVSDEFDYWSNKTAAFYKWREGIPELAHNQLLRPWWPNRLFAKKGDAECDGGTSTSTSTQ